MRWDRRLVCVVWWLDWQWIEEMTHDVGSCCPRVSEREINICCLYGGPAKEKAWDGIRRKSESRRWIDRARNDHKCRGQTGLPPLKWPISAAMVGWVVVSRCLSYNATAFDRWLITTTGFSRWDGPLPIDFECDLRAPICCCSSSFTGIDSTGETPIWSGPARARSRSPFYLAIKWVWWTFLTLWGKKEKERYKVKPAHRRNHITS